MRSCAATLAKHPAILRRLLPGELSSGRHMPYLTDARQTCAAMQPGRRLSLRPPLTKELVVIRTAGRRTASLRPTGRSTFATTPACAFSAQHACSERTGGVASRPRGPCTVAEVPCPAAAPARAAGAPCPAGAPAGAAGPAEEVAAGGQAVATSTPGRERPAAHAQRAWHGRVWQSSTPLVMNGFFAGFCRIQP
jgi:hypothetical protein